jgi:hypothetical protein
LADAAVDGLSPPKLDGFHSRGGSPSLSGFTQPPGPAPTVASLLPDLERLSMLPEVVGRFGSDFPIVRDPLLSSPTLTNDDRANRAFEFFAEYAERFVAIAAEHDRSGPFVPPKGRTGEVAEDPELAMLEALAEATAPEKRDGRFDARSAAMRPAEVDKKRELTDMLRELHSLGFQDMKDVKTGKDGLRAAAELLSSKHPSEVKPKANDLHFTVPLAKVENHPLFGDPPPSSAKLPEALDPTRRPNAEVDTVGAARAEGVKLTQSEVVAGRAAVPEAHKGTSLERMRRPGAITGSSGGKVLGRNMLWNLLHRFRGGEQAPEDSALEQDQMDRLVTVAIGTLVLVTILVVVLVSL